MFLTDLLIVGTTGDPIVSRQRTSSSARFSKTARRDRLSTVCLCDGLPAHVRTCTSTYTIHLSLVGSFALSVSLSLSLSLSLSQFDRICKHNRNLSNGFSFILHNSCYCCLTLIPPYSLLVTSKLARPTGRTARHENNGSHMTI